MRERNARIVAALDAQVDTVRRIPAAETAPAAPDRKVHACIARGTRLRGQAVLAQQMEAAVAEQGKFDAALALLSGL